MIEKGTVLAGYRIDEVLGHGGMGVVYKATQLSLERTVALKILADVLSDDQTFRERFRREGLLQAAMEHPHIVTVYEAGESKYGLWLAMRLINGPNLKELVTAGRIEPRMSVHLLSQVADALETAHELGLVHRDIKPHNILIGGRNHAYLADFGLTKALGDVGLTRTGQFVGTIDYISPEQIRGERPSASSDIYALGAVLYECLTGSVPYPRESDAAALFAHITEPAPSISTHFPEYPPALDGVIQRAMAKDPSERHYSAIEFMGEVQTVLGLTTGLGATYSRGNGDGGSRETSFPGPASAPPVAGPSAIAGAAPPLAPPDQAKVVTGPTGEAPVLEGPTKGAPVVEPPGEAGDEASPEIVQDQTAEQSDAGEASAGDEEARGREPSVIDEATDEAPIRNGELAEGTTAARPGIGTSTHAPTSEPSGPETSGPVTVGAGSPKVEEQPAARADVGEAENDIGSPRERAPVPKGVLTGEGSILEVIPPEKGAAVETHAGEGPVVEVSETDLADARPGSGSEQEAGPPIESPTRLSEDPATRVREKGPAPKVEGRPTQARPAPKPIVSRSDSAQRLVWPAFRPPAEAAKERRPVVALVAVSILVAVAAAVAGYIVADSQTDGETELRPLRDTAIATRTATAGSLSLTVPETWRSGDVLEIPQFEFESPITASPDEGGSGLIAGPANGTGGTLLPSAFVDLVEELPDPEPVRLGDVETYRYSGLEVPDIEGTLTLYAIPTTQGVSTVACYGPSAALEECESIATTVRFDGATPFPLGPSEDYGKRLNDIVRTLNDVRTTQGRQLRQAKTPSRQADAARKIAAAFERGSRRLAGLDVTPGTLTANLELSAALGRVGRTYSDLAAAARSENRARYERARRRAPAQEARVAQALEALGELGYEIR